jgi:hypothetical protein
MPIERLSGKPNEQARSKQRTIAHQNKVQYYKAAFAELQK